MFPNLKFFWLGSYFETTCASAWARMTKRLPPSLTAAGPEVGPTTRTRNGFATARAQTQNACHCSKFKKARTSCLELISLPVTRTTLTRNGPSPGTRKPVWSIRNFRKTLLISNPVVIFFVVLSHLLSQILLYNQNTIIFPSAELGSIHWKFLNQSTWNGFIELHYPLGYLKLLQAL